MEKNPKKKSKPKKGIHEKKIPEAMSGAGIIELSIEGKIDCITNSLDFEYFHALFDSNRAFGDVALSYGFKGKFIVTGITTGSSEEGLMSEVSFKAMRT